MNLNRTLNEDFFRSQLRLTNLRPPFWPREEQPMLTKKQYQLLTFIHQTLRGSGISPSYDEMKEALGLKSKSGIHRLITGLEERGAIRRLPHRARALEVLRLPETWTLRRPCPQNARAALPQM